MSEAITTCKIHHHSVKCLWELDSQNNCYAVEISSPYLNGTYADTTTDEYYFCLDVLEHYFDMWDIVRPIDDEDNFIPCNFYADYGKAIRVTFDSFVW